MNPSFDVTTDRIGALATLVARGELGAATTPRLEAAIDQALWEDRHVHRVVLDLTGVRFCDHSGLNALVTAGRLAEFTDKDFDIVLGDGHIRDAFALAQMDIVVPIVAATIADVAA